MQTFKFCDRTLTVTYASLPAFVSSRRTSNPDVAMWIVIGIVLVLVGASCILMIVFQKKHTLLVRQIVETEKHKRKLADTARSAHERTIAYASHQLR